MEDDPETAARLMELATQNDEFPFESTKLAVALCQATSSTLLLNYYQDLRRAQRQTQGR